MIFLAPKKHTARPKTTMRGLTCLVAAALAFAACSAASAGGNGARGGKFISMFNVVKFKNQPCTGQVNMLRNVSFVIYVFRNVGKEPKRSGGVRFR